MAFLRLQLLSAVQLLSLLLMLQVTGKYAGPVTPETENVIENDTQLTSASYDDLTNHTSAVVEFVLQNLHRLKNYQERERLERLVTRFKTLVDQLGNRQLQNNVKQQTTHNGDDLEPSALDVKYPFSRNQLSQNEMSLKDKQFDKIQPHRGRLSITLLPRGEEPSRKLQLSKLAELTTPAAAAADASTTTLRQVVLTSTPAPQLAIPKLIPDGKKPKDEDEDADDNDADETEEDSHDEEDELVEELHQSTHQTNKQQGNLSAAPLANLNDDQLIELNDNKRYSTLIKNQDGNTDKNLARAWDSGAAPTMTEISHQQQAIEDDDDDGDDDVDDDDGDNIDFIDPTDHEDDSHQLDDDVKLLNKVIGNLRQVKEVLRRMRLGEEHTR